MENLSASTHPGPSLPLGMTDKMPGMKPALLETSLPLHLACRGKVRDVYDLGESFLFVATDRISAFDVVLSPGIPDKGKILTQMSTFWFRHFGDIENHLLETEWDAFPAEVRAHPELRGRSVIVRKCRVVPVECVARGYLVGSGLKEYNETGRVCGIELEKGLTTASKLREPIFTPATKEETGHDENISFERMCALVGDDLAGELRALKFEFGIDERAAHGDIVVWIDEVLTPDSSRFWPADRYAVGKNPPSFDKQFVRDWLETTGWDKASTPPELPDDVVMKTREKYIEAFRTLTGAEPEL
jgi:phosphoribosylaminoimidazole-succinocarboxamide synthase